ncbi:MAG TPA: cupin domain-containing protein [Chloroflexota bacterium]|jgi:quercetin dioxygenase-like cupin family protein
MTGCGCALTRRAFVLGTVGAALVAGRAGAQTAEVAAEVLGRGRTDYAEELGGPAELITLKLTFPPGSMLPWHLHPGPVYGIVNSGELTVYQSDGCKAVYGPGSVVIIPRDTVHEEHNEGAVPIEAISTFLLLEGSPVRVPATPPDAVCPAG